MAIFNSYKTYANLELLQALQENPTKDLNFGSRLRKTVDKAESTELDLNEVAIKIMQEEIRGPDREERIQTRSTKKSWNQVYQTTN